MTDHRALDPPLLLECTQNLPHKPDLACRQILGHLLKKAKLEGLCFTIDMERPCYSYLDVHICGHANPSTHLEWALVPGPDQT